jgi:hypothetical protein
VRRKKKRKWTICKKKGILQSMNKDQIEWRDREIKEN